MVVANIPLALLGSLLRALADGQHDQHHVAGRHGPGHRHSRRRGDGDRSRTSTCRWRHTANDRLGRAARPADATAVPRLLALLCILSVFIPAFIMEDPLRSLFMPLTLGVGFAMISSYLLSSTFVPIMCVFLLKHTSGADERSRAFRPVPQRLTAKVVNAVRPPALARRARSILAACALILGVLGLQVGTELFPQIDSGEFVLRFRPPPGSNFELTRRDGHEVPGRDRAEAKPENIDDHDGLRRPGGPELRHRQHGAVHARARRRLAARGLERRQRHQARRVPRAAAEGSARAGRSPGWPNAWNRAVCPQRTRSREAGRGRPSASNRAISSPA